MAIAVVGLTGGIASGKSTVAEFFAELGVPVVDADALAREVVQPGSEALQEIQVAFGDRAIAADGRLDRAWLGRRVFGDEEARKCLNSIMHPRIAQLSQERLAELGDGEAPFALYEAALLIENQRHEDLEALIVVEVSPQTQVQRLMARDALSEPEALERIAAQLPLGDKVRLADWVINNELSPAETRQRTVEVYEQLCQRLAAKATQH